jgi:hypothetical protein
MFKKLFVFCLAGALFSCQSYDVAPKAVPVVTSPKESIVGAAGNIKDSQNHIDAIKGLADKASEKGLPQNSPEAAEIKNRATKVGDLLVDARVKLGAAEGLAGDMEKERNQYLQNWQDSNKTLGSLRTQLSEAAGKISVIAKQRNVLAGILSLILLGVGALVVLKLSAAGRLF